MSDIALRQLVDAIVADDLTLVSRLLEASPSLARASFKVGASRQAASTFFLPTAGYIYAGHTALHVAAAAYRTEIVRKLLDAGADIHARNRRGAEPLHAAAVGLPGSPAWNPEAQVATIHCLIAAGADLESVDKTGVAPLHRAIRTRCAAAVRALLDAGADPRRKNKNGSTPMLLAIYNTGRGGTGSPEAKAQQQEIQQLLEQHAKS